MSKPISRFRYTLGFACPQCNAPAGEYCRNGEQVSARHFHAERDRAAHAPKPAAQQQSPGAVVEFVQPEPLSAETLNYLSRLQLSALACFPIL